MKTLLRFSFLLIANIFCSILYSQDTTNMGKEFWVGYGHHQFMEAGANSQQMTIYLATGSQPATVTVTIDSSSAIANPATWWSRTYNIPANTVIDIETTIASSFTVSAGASGPLPKTGTQDARLYSDPPPASGGSNGLFRRKAIHIESDVPIVAYAHIYGSLSSGATMLMPVEAWGGLYTSANSTQSYQNNCYSWLYVIAKYDNTVIEITPSVKTRAQNYTGLQPNVAKTITLMRGQIYQVMGANIASDADGNGGSSADGYQLTGTIVRSITSPTGYIHPIAVFSGSSRTSNPMSCGTGGGDNDMQQHFPRQAMGKIYLTTPFSNSGTPSSFSTSKYKVMVFDPATVVTRNGVVLSSLVANTYYEFESNTPDKIVADQPILVAQFMGGGSCIGASGALGDPEMVYLSPLSQGINSARFYRNTKEGISVNYLSIIVPTTAVATTLVDGSNVFDHSLVHPQDANYTILIKRWAPAAKAQVEVQSTGTIVGTTYGLGSVESYAYNLGTKLNAVNARDASVLPPGFTGVLPVTLIGFNATKNVNDVLLKWNTSYEINFDRFEVERSLNGTEFGKFATVKSMQSGSGAYTANDANALRLYAAQPVIYYRLKMVDKDGKFKYSGVVTVKSGNVRSLEIMVAPNPFKDKLQLQVQSEKAGLANITVRDISGRLIESRSQLIAAGSTTIEINSLADLQKGIYIVEIEMNGVKQQVKAVK